MKPEYGSGLFILPVNLNETGVKHSEVVFYKDVLGFLRNCFHSHLGSRCPALASIATVEEELLEKRSASVLHSNGDEEKAEESVFGFFSLLFMNVKEMWSVA